MKFASTSCADLPNIKKGVIAVFLTERESHEYVYHHAFIMPYFSRCLIDGSLTEMKKYLSLIIVSIPIDIFETNRC